jgi:POLQ-like helicase
MLYDLWNQRSVWDVANEYEVPRGIVQNLMTSAAAFSSCVLRFCEVRKYSIHRRVITELTFLLRTLACLLSTYSPMENVIMLLVFTKNTQIERKCEQLQLFYHDK